MRKCPCLGCPEMITSSFIFCPHHWRMVARAEQKYLKDAWDPESEAFLRFYNRLITRICEREQGLVEPPRRSEPQVDQTDGESTPAGP